MSKRRKEQLTKDTYDASSSSSSPKETPYMGFQRADPDEIAKRRFVRPPITKPTSQSSNPFAGVNLVNGGAVPPPRKRAVTGSSSLQKATPVASRSVKKQSPAVPRNVNQVCGDLMKLLTQAKDSAENLDSVMIVFLEELDRSTGSLKSSATSPLAVGPPKSPSVSFSTPAAAPSVSFGSSAAPAPSSVSFGSSAPPATSAFGSTAPAFGSSAPAFGSSAPAFGSAAPAFGFSAPASFAPSADDDNDAGADSNDNEPGIQDGPDEGWRSMCIVPEAKVSQFVDKEWKLLGIGKLKLQQDEADPTKYRLGCGNLINRFVNSYVQAKAEPKLVPEQPKPGAKFRNVQLMLYADDSFKVHSFKMPNAQAVELFDALQAATKTMKT